MNRKTTCGGLRVMRLMIVIHLVALLRTFVKVNSEEISPINDGLRKKLALLLFNEVPGNHVVSSLLLRLQLCKLIAVTHGRANTQILAVLGLKSNFQICGDSVLPLLKNWQHFDSMWLNAIFVNDSNAIHEIFFNHSMSMFGVDILKVGYKLPVASTTYINGWVSSLSLKRIPWIMDPNDIDANTAMVLASAAYLKTFWYNPFLEKATTLGTFRTMHDKPFRVQMMNKLGHVAYLDDKSHNLKIADIDLAIPQMTMTIIVPNDANGLPLLLKNMTKDPNFVSGLRKRMEPTSVLLSIPRFKIKTYVGWQGFLEQIGLVDIFDSNSDCMRVLRKDWAKTKVDVVKQHIFLQVEESTMQMPGYPEEEIQPYMVNWDALKAERPFYFSFNFLIGQDHLNREDFLVGVYYGP